MSPDLDPPKMKISDEDAFSWLESLQERKGKSAIEEAIEEWLKKEKKKLKKKEIVLELVEKPLRATVPESIVRFLEIESGDKLEWKMDIQDDKPVAIVRRVRS